MLSSIASSFHQFLGTSPYTIVCITNQSDPELLTEWSKRLVEFEKQFEYPFSSNIKFRIQHGSSSSRYFDFFNHLGSYWCFYIALNTREFTNSSSNHNTGQVNICLPGEIAGAACGVLQSRGWYVCDLKVATKYRGQHIPMLLFQRGCWRFSQCASGYGISMAVTPEDVPKSSSIFQLHSGIIGFSNDQCLTLYSMGYKAAKKYVYSIAKIFNKYGYNYDILEATTKRTKRYYFVEHGKNKGKEWNIRHLLPYRWWKAESAGEVNQINKHDFVKLRKHKRDTYIVSCHKGSSVDQDLFQLLNGQSTVSYARISSVGMGTNYDWNLISSIGI